jgi:hypothetical protein
MTKAIPKKKWPKKGKLCWIEWHDAVDTKGSDGNGEVAIAYTCGCYWGQRFQDVRGKRVKVVVMLYNYFDTGVVDDMSIPVKNVTGWGYGRVPKGVAK